jgi:hypothetical protein
MYTKSVDSNNLVWLKKIFILIRRLTTILTESKQYVVFFSNNIRLFFLDFLKLS